MPIHDWPRKYEWLFHDLCGEWIRTIGRALNSGLLPSGYYALTERWTGWFTLDALQEPEDEPGLTPATPVVHRVGGGDTSERPARAVTVRDERDDRLVAVCEVVRPNYETGEVELSSVAERAVALIERGIHLLLVDVHPPTPAGGTHAAVWRSFSSAPSGPFDRPLALVSYEAIALPKAYVESVAVGDVLPDMPLFLAPGGHIMVPLEKTYLAAWEGVPARWRKVIESKDG